VDSIGMSNTDLPIVRRSLLSPNWRAVVPRNICGSARHRRMRAAPGGSAHIATALFRFLYAPVQRCGWSQDRSLHLDRHPAVGLELVSSDGRLIAVEGTAKLATEQADARGGVLLGLVHILGSSMLACQSTLVRPRWAARVSERFSSAVPAAIASGATEYSARTYLSG